MKTWEMLKELTENPKKRFKRKNWEGVYICSKNGFICDSNGRLHKWQHYEMYL
jgi:hypothetical protein